MPCRAAAPAAARWHHPDYGRARSRSRSRSPRKRRPLMVHCTSMPSLYPGSDRDRSRSRRRSPSHRRRRSLRQPPRAAWSTASASTLAATRCGGNKGMTTLHCQTKVVATAPVYCTAPCRLFSAEPVVHCCCCCGCCCRCVCRARGQKVCRPAGPVRWAPGGGAALQPLQGAANAIEVPRRVCNMVLNL